MESIRIVLLSIFAAVFYGILHDQITARICVEYFTIGHPPVFHTRSSTVLGFGWGIIATWWVGLLLGIPLAKAAQSGAHPKIKARQLVRPLAKLLLVTGLIALLAGCMGSILLNRGSIALPDFLTEVIPRQHQAGFMADWWAHSASYLVGLIGGIILIILTGRRRRSSLPRSDNIPSAR